MFKAELRTLLLSNTTLYSVISNYGSGKAVFDTKAPQDAQFPYLTYRVMQTAGEHKAITKFVLFIDFFDQSASSTRTENVEKLLENILDDARLTSSDHYCIRISRFASSIIDEPDLIKHLNAQFEVRADRRYWTNT
jgi:hypothetical protein